MNGAHRDNPPSAEHSPVRCRRGIVLILVLVVVAMLALAGYAFSDLMLTEYEAAHLSGSHMQSQALAESGIDFARVFLLNDLETRYQQGGTYDNPELFRGMLVVDDEDPDLCGRFTLVAPRVEEGALGGIRYGLENESSRLNLNALVIADMQAEEGGRQLLMGLPGMTEDVADAIMDWLDEDDDVREIGAEVDYYSGLDPPYAPRNGPLETVEELLLVRGVTPELLFGLDTNRNGMVDPHEAGWAAPPVDTETQGAMDRGWSAYLTLYSQERNADAQGQPRIYLNQEDMQQLHAELSAVFPAEWANFIVAYRQNGPSQSESETVSPTAGTLDLTKSGRFNLTQVLDLVEKKTRVVFQGDEKASTLKSPFANDPIAMSFYMPLLMDKATVNNAPTIPGRVNINQATRVVLSGIPGIDDEVVNQILSLRSAEPEMNNLNRRHETWLLTEAVVTLDEMRALVPFVTAGGDVYRTQVVGYFDGGHAATRAEVILDATSPRPRVLLWRDISHLGRGYALETLGVGVAEE